MLYIHKLNQLAPRTADVESVYLIRELKQKTPYPFTQEKMQEYFGDFFLSDTDKEMMVQALALVEPTVEQVRQILLERNEIHEPANLQRAVQVLKEMPEALQNNINYAQEILPWQSSFITEVAPLFNSIPKLRSPEEKMACNQKVNVLFQKVLRNKEFAFNFGDIVHEAHVAHITGLSESMAKGFFFHYTLEEELKKLDFATLKLRLPREKVEEVERIQKNIEIIKRGLDRAYETNMRMVNWGLVMYAYVKWLMGGV